LKRRLDEFGGKGGRRVGGRAAGGWRERERERERERDSKINT
jgi:hypothetical protein